MGCFGSRTDSRRKGLTDDWTGCEFAFNVGSISTLDGCSPLDKIVIKFRREGTDVEVIGLNQASATLVDKFAIHDKDGADDLLLDH